MRHFTALAAAAALAALLIAAPAGAQQIARPQLAFSNLGQDGSFGTDYYYVSGPVNHALTYGAPFVPTVSGALDHIDLPLRAETSNAGVVVYIFPDQHGVPATYDGGDALEEWLSSKMPQTPAAVKFVSKRKPMLTAGQKYWVVVAPMFYDSVVHWQLNSTGQAGVDATTGAFVNQWFQYDANGGFMPALDVWVK
jgi:hypothetical protein